MKWAIPIFSAVAVWLLIASCSTDSITGSGNIAIQDRTVAPISSITSNGVATVHVTQGTVQSVRVEADDNIINNVKTNVVNGLLDITISTGSFNNVRIDIYVTVTEIDQLTSYGSGDIFVDGLFVQPEIRVTLFGSGNVQFDSLSSTKFTSEIKGSGNLILAGTAAICNAMISGSGNFEGLNCNTATSALAIFGSGRASISVSDLLYADIFGSGDINYRGNATVRLNRTGSGQLTKMV